jgi:hypothetical protein
MEDSRHEVVQERLAGGLDTSFCIVIRSAGLMQNTLVRRQGFDGKSIITSILLQKSSSNVMT